MPMFSAEIRLSISAESAIHADRLATLVVENITEKFGPYGAPMPPSDWPSGLPRPVDALVAQASVESVADRVNS